jgi:hypothetical protein
MDFSPRRQPSMHTYVSFNDAISNPDKDETIIVHTSRFDGFVDATKALSNEGHHGSKEMRLMALYPPHLPEMFCQSRGITWAEFWGPDNQKWVKEMLNDPLLSDFRVHKGRA